MPRVIMTVGCPGSGKTTWAKKQDPKFVILSLDDFRVALFRGKRQYWERLKEGAAGSLVERAFESALGLALRMGLDVIVCNTHVRYNTARRTLEIARGYDAEVELMIFSRPAAMLQDINHTRPLDDRVSDEIVLDMVRLMYEPDAWWRTFEGSKTFVNSGNEKVSA